ncbi:MAG: rRNA maturation RNase YbeY [Candidatus Omnitrophota bacterium]
MPTRINCENRNSKRRIDLARIEKAARKVLGLLKKSNIELNIIFFSNQKIRALNRKFMGIDRSTDVISFDGAGSFLGDVAISSDMSFKNAKIYGATFMEETVLYVIHGILHLVGYDDRTVNARTAMKEKENGLFQKIKGTF